MNRVRDSRSIFSQILHRRYHHQQQPTSLRRRQRLTDLFSSFGEFIKPPHIRSDVRPSSTVSPPLHLQYGTPSRRRFVLRWYHEPWKVTVATAITLTAAVMAAYDREIVPCTYRSHLVIYSHQEASDLGDTVFAEDIAGATNYVILDPSDPRSMRFRRIAERIVHAAHRGLGIYDSNDAPMLRITEKRRKWGKKQPHTSHLPQVNWEVILIKDDYPNAGILPNGKIIVNTGLFDWYKTDEEIAAIIAHEVGSILLNPTANFGSRLIPDICCFC